MAEEWLECQQRIDAYVDEQVSACCQEMLWARHVCQGDQGRGGAGPVTGNEEVGAGWGILATDFPKGAEILRCHSGLHSVVPEGGSSC